MEFALVFPVVFLMLYGLITFGAVLYTQMAVARAVTDGARAVQLLPALTDAVARKTSIEDEIIESLAASAIAPSNVNQTLESRRGWMAANVRSRITVTEAGCVGDIVGTCATITLAFPYGDADGTRIFPSITFPGIGGTETWIPDSLVSKATVRL
ncbi:MAG: TadE/TadG family type IV pilus assembly protein [Panacagrimonas sp.]